MLTVVCLIVMLCGVPAYASVSSHCSKSCAGSDEENAGKYRCSCSPSCSLFGDCCYDSLFNPSGQRRSRVSTMCLPLADVGNVKVINGCPRTWSGSMETCRKSIGHLPPVYSPRTGITYASALYAGCNGDGNVIPWKAETVCCGTAEKPDLESAYEFLAVSDALWKMAADNGTRNCSCTFRLQEPIETFLSKMEVRRCERSVISKCSAKWPRDKVRALCSSYLDPVYLGNKTYRNAYCPICNHEKEDRPSCVPPIMDEVYQRNLTREEMIEYCQTNHLDTCLHYLSNS